MLLEPACVSVIIPVHCGGEALEPCLQSVSRLNPGPGEVILADDGGTPNIGDLGLQYGFNVVHCGHGSGPSAARNIGARHAVGDLLFFVDSDVVVPSDIIASLINEFETNSGISAIFGSYDDEPGARNFVSQYKNLFHHYIHQTSRPDAQTFWTACGAVPRNLFLEYGGFDERLRTVEDIDLGYRLTRDGHRILLCRKLQVKHLKKWTATTLVISEIFGRAVPWTRLLIRYGRLNDDLNLRYESRISATLVFLLVFSLLAGAFQHNLLILAPIFITILLILNLPLYEFFIRKRGVAFGICAVLWHWLYYLCGASGLMLGLISCLHRSGNVTEKFMQALSGLLLRRITLRSDGIPYRISSVPLRKVINAIVTESSVYFKPLRPWGWPTHLMIEPTNHCNLRCRLCPVTKGFEREQGMMSLDLFRKILDEIGPYVFTLQLWDWGEPFLNPEIYNMISYARGKGVKVISSTNGHIFASGDHAERLVDSGLDTIIFAVDGATQATYELYRHGGDLNTSLTGIRKVLSEKNAAGSPCPTVNLRFVVTSRNEHEIPVMRGLAAELGVDVLSFKTLNDSLKDPYADGEVMEPGLGPRDVRFQRFRKDLEGRRIRRKNNPCKQLWNCPSIHWNGNVCLCSLDPQDRCVTGNVRDTAFREIWYGEIYRGYRKEFRTNWNGMLMCGQCSYAYEGGSLNCETVPEVVFFPTFGKPSRSVSGTRA